MSLRGIKTMSLQSQTTVVDLEELLNLDEAELKQILAETLSLQSQTTDVDLEEMEEELIKLEDLLKLKEELIKLEERQKQKPPPREFEPAPRKQQDDFDEMINALKID